MSLFKKAGNMLGSSVINHISQELSLARPSFFQAIRYMSSSKLFIGGLSYSTDDAGLRDACSKYGEVADVKVIVDRESGRSRGFGFVTYNSVEDASAALQALDQQELQGRRIRVDYANDRQRAFSGGGGGGDGGGFRGGNFGGSGYGGGNYARQNSFNSGSGFGGDEGFGGKFGSEKVGDEAGSDEDGSLEGKYSDNNGDESNDEYADKRS